MTPRRTDIAALVLAAVVVIASTVLAVTHNPVPTVFPILAVALVTGALGIAQPTSTSALLEKLAEGLTPAAPDNTSDLATQLVANAIAQQQQPPAAVTAPAPVTTPAPAPVTTPAPVTVPVPSQAAAAT